MIKHLAGNQYRNDAEIISAANNFFFTIKMKVPFICNTTKRSVLIARGNFLKNKPHLVKFHAGILVSFILVKDSYQLELQVALEECRNEGSSVPLHSVSPVYLT